MKPTTVGVIGIGRIGRMHTKNLVHAVPDAYVKAVVSRTQVDPAWADALGIPVRSTNVDKILKDPEIEAVVITAPSGLHVELIRRAAAAGKHIFCEKPVAFEPAPIEQAQAAATAAGVKLQVGFNRRFDPSLLKMWQGVQAGEVGEIHQLRVTNRDPKAPPIEFVKRSGGLFFDFAIHDFDTIRFLSESEIVELFAVEAVLVDPEIGRAGDVDTAVITVRLANGALGVIDCSRQTNYGYDQRFEVFGSKGSLVVENTTPTTVVSSSKAGVVADTPHENFVGRYREAFIAELSAFVAAVREGLPVRAGADDALAAVKVAAAAKASHETHLPVRLSANVQATSGGQRR
jgi:myo-inositol 2-dehydrogenase / D-chiro-inositol 1-dehydrogenase